MLIGYLVTRWTEYEVLFGENRDRWCMTDASKTGNNLYYHFILNTSLKSLIFYYIFTFRKYAEHKFSREPGLIVFS